MSSYSKGRIARVLTMIAGLSTCVTLATAQYQAAPKWEIYGGYSFLYPGANVHGTLPLGLVPLSSRLESNPRGAGAAVTYNFNRWFGLTLDTSTNWGSRERRTANVSNRIDDAGFSNISIGPKVTFRGNHFSPFFEGLVGDHRLMPDAFHDVDRLGGMAGGGLDINLSRHVAWRMLRADYVFSTYQYGPKGVPDTAVRGVRLQTGLNLMFGGGAPAVSPSAACVVQP